MQTAGDPMCIVGRLFNRSLVTLVSQNDMRRLLVAHSRINTLICHYRYTLTILAVKMNHQRLVVCVEDGIFIHNMRDMQLLHKVEETPPNRNGVIALSANESNCYLAYPGSHRVGTVFIFDALSFQNVTSIAAHDGLLACLTFNARANLLATASEKGTVIRVFSIPQGEKVIEFRRGLTRCVSICSLSFSMNSQYLVAASHTETVHVFKLESRSSEKTPEVQTDHYTRQRTTSTSSGASQGAVCSTDDGDPPSSDDIPTNYSGCIDINAAGLDNTTTNTTGATTAAAMASWSQGLMGWMGSTLKSYSSYLPHQVSEIFAQDRAFAYARIPCTSMNSPFRPPPGSGGSPVTMTPTRELVNANYIGSTPAIPQGGGSLMQPSPGQRKVAALVYYQNQPRLIVAGLDGLVHIFSIDSINGGEGVLIRTQRLLSPLSASNNQPTSLSSVAMNPNSPYDSTSLPTSNITNNNISTSTGDGNTSKNLSGIRTGGPQQPGVYALPASVATTAHLSSVGSNPGVVTSGKVNTFASVVAGGLIKDEGGNQSPNSVDSSRHDE
ncbi:WD repeat domain phosphoinositide-interacting protein 2 [Schistosoma japonicum]|nr:WD repeat domain phosphoinositide-interacting protein 2 [Schistosoma japonicum]